MEMFPVGGLQVKDIMRRYDGGSGGGGDLISPEVGFLLCRPDHKRDVAILSFLLPDVERWGFQHVSIHHRDGPDKAPSEGEVCQVARGPGRVLLPGDGLSQNARFTTAVTAKTALLIG